MSNRKMTFIDYNNSKIADVVKGFKWNGYTYRTIEEAKEAIDKSREGFVPIDPSNPKVNGNIAVQARKRNNILNIKQPMQTKNIFFQGKIYAGCDERQVDYLLMIATASCPFLSDITSHPYIGEEELQEGQEVEVGVHFELRIREFDRETKESWLSIDNYAEHFNEEKYGSELVAIGIPKSTVPNCSTHGNNPNLDCVECFPTLSEKTEECMHLDQDVSFSPGTYTCVCGKDFKKDPNEKTEEKEHDVIILDSSLKNESQEELWSDIQRKLFCFIPYNLEAIRWIKLMMNQFHLTRK